jgi:hypothetical protein
MKNIKNYYKELGRLVYAVAIADGAVQMEEREKLHEFVLKVLANNEHSTDSSGMNQAFYVDFEFEESEKNQRNLNGAINVFSRFIEQNHELQDKALIERSIGLLEAVALAYSKKNETKIIQEFKLKTSSLFAIK